MSFILQALNRLRPGVGVSVNAEDLDQIVWYGDVEAPSKEEIEDEILKIKEEEALVEYKKLRKLEYPSIEECVHAILDDKLEELQAKRLAVKEKYPKPVVEPVVEEPIVEEPIVEEPIEEPKEVPSE